MEGTSPQGNISELKVYFNRISSRCFSDPSGFPGHSCLRSACLFLIPEISRQYFLVACVLVWDFSGGVVFIVTVVLDLNAEPGSDSSVTSEQAARRR